MNESDRNNITKAYAKAQALFATEEEVETGVDQEGYEEECEEDVDYDYE